MLLMEAIGYAGAKTARIKKLGNGDGLLGLIIIDVQRLLVSNNPNYYTRSVFPNVSV